MSSSLLEMHDQSHIPCRCGLCWQEGAGSPSGQFSAGGDQGYLFAGFSCGCSLQLRMMSSSRKEEILKNTPGVKYYSSIIGYNMLSSVTNTYSAFFFIALDEWKERKKPEEHYNAIKAHINREFSQIPGAMAFAFSPPAIPGIGTSGGATFVLQDRAGKDIALSCRKMYRNS
jgi:HAE1 family hydrophobic/amphiphilic exporter-1